MLYVLSLAKITPPTITDYIACETTREVNRPVKEGEDNWVTVKEVQLCPSFMMCVEQENIVGDHTKERDYVSRLCP